MKLVYRDPINRDSTFGTAIYEMSPCRRTLIVNNPFGFGRYYNVEFPWSYFMVTTTQPVIKPRGIKLMFAEARIETEDWSSVGHLLCPVLFERHVYEDGICIPINHQIGDTRETIEQNLINSFFFSKFDYNSSVCIYKNNLLKSCFSIPSWSNLGIQSIFHHMIKV